LERKVGEAAGLSRGTEGHAEAAACGRSRHGEIRANEVAIGRIVRKTSNIRHSCCEKANFRTRNSEWGRNAEITEGAPKQ
jgi:hypothetical protein